MLKPVSGGGETLARRFRRMLTGALPLLTLAFIACDDYDDTELRNSVDDLQNRVSKLEEQTARLNTDYTTLSRLVTALQGNIYVSEVETTADGCKIVFSDGTTATIRDGANGQDAPVIGIGKDTDGVYYWTKTADGKTEWLLDAEGRKLPVSGTAPVLGVDAEGYWTVSYDGGTTFTRLLDAAGQPVVAQGDSTLFKSATADDDYLYITLNDDKGTLIKIARESSFLLTIKDAPELAEFAFGQTMEFQVESVGVTKVVVNKPDEWKVALADGVLRITAPAAEHAACADTEGEIVLVYFDAAYRSKYVALPVAVTAVEARIPEISVPTDFSGGYVQQAVYNGQQVAEICLEYIRTDDVDRQMTVIYPMSNGKADLTKGIDVATGGTVVWNTTANTCTYTAGTSGPVSKFYVGDDGGLLTSVEGETEAAVVSPELLRDVRGTEVQEYRIAKIGTQYWMAESLRAERYADGSAIATDWSNTAGAYIYYNESAADWKNIYGTLYSGYAVLSEAGLAPEGWEIPSTDAISALSTYIGTTPGTKLKSQEGWVTSPGSNITGFDALPGMYYTPASSTESFGGATPDVLFWTSTTARDFAGNGLIYYRVYDATTRFYFDPNPSSFAVTLHAYAFGHYVRCIRK